MSKLMALLVGFSFLALPTAAQELPREVRNQIEQIQQQKLRGWNGIIFYCHPDADFSTLKDFCAAVRTNAEFLARSSRVPFELVPNFFEVYVTAAERKALIIVVKGQSTGNDGTVGFLSHIKVYGSYGRAVELGAPEGDPRATPRSIEGVVWDRSIVGVGRAGSELVGLMANGTDQVLKSFFVEYMKANPR